MKNALLLVALYSLIAAFGQMLLKVGTNQLGQFTIRNFSDFLCIVPHFLKNPLVLSGAIIFVSGFFFWTTILSWFPLGVVFPLTAMTYIFVVWMSYFTLGETLGLVNYIGMLLIAAGVYFLLQR